MCLSLYFVFRCEDIGRELKIPGTYITDVICGDFKTRTSFFFFLHLVSCF